VTASGRSTGDPNVHAITVAVASFGLAGSRVAWPTRPLGDEAWHALLTACTEQHLVGLLGAATAGGALSLDRRHRGGLDAVLTEWGDRSARLERDTLELSGRLVRAGIDHRIVDGPIIAHRAYRPPERRLYGAVDILVADAGAGRDRLDDLASGRRLRLTADLLAGSGPVVVDLAELPPRAETTRVGGHRLPSLPIDAQLVAACVASVDGRPSLATVRDVAQLALGDGATVEGVTRWADRWRVTDRVAEAIRRSWAVFDLADKIGLSAWAQRVGSANGPPFFGSLWSLWRPQRSNNRGVVRR
jgi:hypothetical protein